MANKQEKNQFVQRIELKVVENETSIPMQQINSPDKAATIIDSIIGNMDRECFITLLLDTKHYVIGYHIVSIGTLNSTAVHPREVFKAAMLTNSAAVIVAHNHPTGDCTPSSQDIEVTKRLREAGELVGISVLDALVLGKGRFHSYQAGSVQNFLPMAADPAPAADQVEQAPAAPKKERKTSKKTNKKSAATAPVILPAAEQAPAIETKSKLLVDVETALAARGCNCKPYTDTKTISGWNKEGFMVKKGETALATYRRFVNGQVKVHGVFCRCQVESR